MHWSMFLTFFRNSTKNTGKYVKERSPSFLNLKTELKNSFVFLLSFLFRQIVNIECVLFRPHCIISASIQDFELKLSTFTTFGTLISNLKLNFQYNIVMMS